MGHPIYQFVITKQRSNKKEMIYMPADFASWILGFSTI